MPEKFYKTEKFQKIFYPILYFLCTVVFVLSGCFIFYRTYYSNVYVSGASMSPTLMGGNNGQRHHYGISDNHDVAKRNLKRFDVVITYYPSSWVPGVDEDTTYKIKRVWGFPGETLTMTCDENKYTFTVRENNEIKYQIDGLISKKDFENLGNLTVATFKTDKKTFNTNITQSHLRSEWSISLSAEKQEYFLMGDNWSSSSDSFTHLSSSSRITYTHLQGKVIAINGTAQISNGELVDKKRIRNMYSF